MTLKANSSSSSECSDASDEFCELQYVFLMVLDEDQKHLLMFDEDGEWYPPFFEYTYQSGRHKARACLQLQEKLGIPMERQYLTARYDALGAMYTHSMNGKETRAYSNFLVVDLSYTDFDPGLPAAWHDVSSVSKIAEKTHRSRGPSDCVHESIFEVALEVLRGEYPRPYRNDIRYRDGWFQNASNYFMSAMADVGIPVTEEVFQYSHSETSTVLAVNTEQGRYYLKAPAAGSHEIRITRAILQHLPEYTLHVIGTNNEVNCFVSESLEVLDTLDLGTVEDPAGGKVVVSTLAKMQLDSRACLASLEISGIQRRSPLAIAKQIEWWVRKDSFPMKSFPSGMKEFSESVEMIQEALRIVHNSGIPMTLVHGDVSESNFGRKKDEEGEYTWVLYDWQYACISHPFFDLHRIHPNLSPEVVERYLTHWTDFATMEDLKRVLPIACKLAWLLKAWTIIECVEACCPALCPPTVEFFFDCLSKTKYRWQDLGLKFTRTSTGYDGFDGSA